MTKKLSTVLLVLFCSHALAQDSHYWTSEYSPAGFLTPGAVIANNGDSGVVFFNPALLAHISRRAASISGNLYRLQTNKIKNGVGGGRNLSSTNTGIVPLMISATRYIDGKRPFSFGYTLVQNPQIRYQVNQQREASFQVLQDYYSAGNETFIGQYSANNELSTTTATAGAGIALFKNWSVGIAVQGDVISRSLWSDVSMRAFINPATPQPFPAFVNVQEYYEASYTSVGARLKAGLAYDKGPHHLGILLTSPFVQVYGRASLLADFLIARLKLDASVPEINVLANTRQKKIKSRLKAPMSAATAYTYDHGNGQVYAAVEFFTGIKEYSIITPRNEYFIKGDSNTTLLNTSSVKLKDARRSVINVGIGVSRNINHDKTAFLSARTDFTYARPSGFKDTNGYIDYISNWNILRWQAGVNIKRKKYNLRSGFVFSYGRTSEFKQPVNFDTPNEANVLAGEPANTSARHFSGGLLLGFVHNF